MKPGLKARGTALVAGGFGGSDTEDRPFSTARF